MPIARWLWPALLTAVALSGFAPLAGPAVVILLGYLPGRALNSALGIDRSWSASGRAALACVASQAIAPVPLNVLWHFTNDARILLLSWCVLLILAASAAWFWRRNPVAAAAPPARMFCEGRSTCIVLVLLVLLVVVATIGPYWPSETSAGPMPALIHDFVKHHAVLFSLEHRPLPLHSPFFVAAADAPVFYYHFFYLAPATLRAVCPAVSIQLAFGLQSVLVGVSIMLAFYLIAKRIAGEGAGLLAAILCTVVGGLDIIPLLVLRQFVVTLDAWADHVVRIHNFLNQMIWSPQNMLGVLVVLVGVNVLGERGWTRAWLWLAPLLGAALLGSSIWVAIAAFGGLVLLVLFELAARLRERRRCLALLGGAAIVAVLTASAAAPTLRGYVEMSARHGKSLTTEWPYQWNALLGRFAPPGVFANLLDLPWVLLIELGPLLLFPLMLPRRAWRDAWQDRGLRLLMLGGLVAVAGFATVRSHFTYNDFGQKIMLVAMSAGVLLAALLASPRPRAGRGMLPFRWELRRYAGGRARPFATAVFASVLLLGLPVGTYEAPLTAIRRWLPASGPLARLAHPDSIRAREEAGALRFLKHKLPAEAVVQADWSTARVNLVQVIGRPLGVMVLEQDTMVFVPADISALERALGEVSAALEQPADAPACHAALRSLGVTHVFVGVVERENWHGLEKLDDARFFEPVFRENQLAVYAVKRLPAESAPAATPAARSSP